MDSISVCLFVSDSSSLLHSVSRCLLPKRPLLETLFCKKKKKKAICLSFAAPSLSLDDLFDCIAALSSSFGRLGQRKPCHNSEFLTRLQLPGRATADQRWINTRDKPRQSRRIAHELGKGLLTAGDDARREVELNQCFMSYCTSRCIQGPLWSLVSCWHSVAHHVNPQDLSWTYLLPHYTVAKQVKKKERKMK